MKMLSLQKTPETVFMNAMRLVVFIASSIAGGAGALAVQPGGDWQVQRLLHPTAAQRAQEQQGHIFIYDGISERDVKRAMDQGFDRIGSMMFINIKKAKDDSSPVRDDGEDDTDDDGCD